MFRISLGKLPIIVIIFSTVILLFITYCKTAENSGISVIFCSYEENDNNNNDDVYVDDFYKNLKKTRLNSNDNNTVFQCAFSSRNAGAYYCSLDKNNVMTVYSTIKDAAFMHYPDEATINFYAGKTGTKQAIYVYQVCLDKETYNKLIQQLNSVRVSCKPCPQSHFIDMDDGAIKSIYYRNKLYSINYDNEADKGSESQIYKFFELLNSVTSHTGDG